VGILELSVAVTSPCYSIATTTSQYHWFASPGTCIRKPGMTLPKLSTIAALSSQTDDTLDAKAGAALRRGLSCSMLLEL
jgi:hypothetical protein